MKPNIEINKKTIILICSLAATMGIFVIFIKPLFTKVSIISKEVKALDRELAGVRNALEEGKKLDKNKHLLKRHEVSRAINEITNIGTELNISFLSTSPQKIRTLQGEKYPIQPVHLELQSKYKDLGLFLGSLERLSHSVVTVREIEIDRRQELLPEIYAELVLDIYLEEGEGG